MRDHHRRLGESVDVRARLEDKIAPLAEDVKQQRRSPDIADCIFDTHGGIVSGRNVDVEVRRGRAQRYRSTVSEHKRSKIDVDEAVNIWIRSGRCIRNFDFDGSARRSDGYAVDLECLFEMRLDDFAGS